MLGKRGKERKTENKGKTYRALEKRNLSSGNNEGKSQVCVTAVTLR